MKLSKRRGALVAAGVAAAMVLSACGGDEGGGSDEGSGGEGATGGTFSIYIGEPENPLVPGNTNETEGGQVVDSLWTGLVQYDAETNELDVHRRRRVDRVRRQHHLDGHAEGRLDVPRRHPGDRAVVRRRVELHRATARTRRATRYFFAHIAGYDDLQAPDGRRRRRHRRPGRDRDERPPGRRRPDLHRRADRAVRAVPHDRRLQRVLPPAGGLLRGPRGLRRAADRQRPVQGRRAVRPRPGHHPDPVRRLRR